MLITTVSTRIVFGWLVIVSLFDNNFLWFGCLIISCVFTAYFIQWIVCYFYRNRKLEKLDKELNELFEKQNGLLDYLKKIRV